MVFKIFYGENIYCNDMINIYLEDEINSGIVMVRGEVGVLYKCQYSDAIANFSCKICIDDYSMACIAIWMCRVCQDSKQWMITHMMQWKSYDTSY